MEMIKKEKFEDIKGGNQNS